MRKYEKPMVEVVDFSTENIMIENLPGGDDGFDEWGDDTSVTLS